MPGIQEVVGKDIAPQACAMAENRETALEIFKILIFKKIHFQLCEGYLESLKASKLSPKPI